MPHTASGHRKAHRERTPRPLLGYFRRFSGRKRKAPAKGRPSHTAPATERGHRTDPGDRAATGRDLASHKPSAHRTHPATNKTSAHKARPTPPGHDPDADRPRSRAEAARQRAAWHGAQTKSGRRPEKCRAAGAAYADFLKGGGKNRKPRSGKSAARTAYRRRTRKSPGGIPERPKPTESATAPHPTRQAIPQARHRPDTRL